MDRKSLDAIGILEGTDKTSLGQDYLRFYGRIFDRMHNDPIQLLEIGIADGGSLRTWNSFFPNAAIIGVDNNKSCQRFSGGRVTVEIGSQDDPQFLRALAEKYQPDIIIDDGSHQAPHIFISFEHLFPALQPGGYYVIEDLYLHHGTHATAWHRAGGVTPAEYFAKIAQRVAAKYVEAACEPAIQELCGAIDCIEFLRGAIVIQKQSRQKDLKTQTEYMWELAEQSGHGIVWFQLALFLLNNKELERSEVAAQHAVELEPTNPHFFSRLGHAQAARGNLPAAIETARRAVRLAPADPGFQAHLAHLETRLAAIG